MQKHANLVDLVKSFPTNICLQNLASIQKRTSPMNFAHSAEKSGNGSISNLSTKDMMGGFDMHDASSLPEGITKEVLPMKAKKKREERAARLLLIFFR